MLHAPIEAIERGLEILAQLIELRMRGLSDDAATSTPDAESLFATIEELDLLPDRNLDRIEAVTLLLALAPHLRPDLVDPVFRASGLGDGDYPEIGGARGGPYRGFLPTGQTVSFLLGGHRVAERLQIQRVFADDHFFHTHDLVQLESAAPGGPTMSGLLTVSEDFVGLLTTGSHPRPRFGMEFPARRLTTRHTWGDLVLADETASQLQHLKNWLEHRETVLGKWGMSRVLRSGYTALFYGPPGTGKTMTAALLGGAGREVYRIDLAMVVSKFIGETEKNLEKVFRRAERKNWILFFDEADSLFSRRTGVRDAHDKYANQETAYLLQRIEQFTGSGLVILASNLKGNIDEAFLRRFQSVIYFPKPTPEARLKIWKRLIPDGIRVEEGFDIERIWRKYDLTGANIVNVTQFCLICACARNSTEILGTDIELATAEEYSKEGKTV